jgi:hypothetical protein
MRLVLLAAVLTGCGEVHFVDPNPPRLFRSSVTYTSTAVDEPVVWIAILDLFFEDTSGCDWARAATLSALRQGFAAAGARQLELTAQDLSPDCRSRGERPLDVAAVQTQFDAAQAAFPGAHVRPVIVYVDDVDLPMRNETFIALRAVRVRADLPALFWAVSYPSVAGQLGADGMVRWTYAGDGELATRMRAAVQAELPLKTTAPLSSGPIPLLDAAQLETTREFKLCKPPDPAASGYPSIGRAHALDRAHPPTVTFAPPAQVALPKSLFTASTFDVQLEGCTESCDRYFIGEPGADPIRWDESTGCLLRNR